jgi:hypothetical protein
MDPKLVKEIKEITRRVEAQSGVCKVCGEPIDPSEGSIHIECKRSRSIGKNPRKRNGFADWIRSKAKGGEAEWLWGKLHRKRKRTKAAAAKPATRSRAAAPVSSPVVSEVASALRNLGYRAPNARKMAEAAYASTGSASFSTVIRAALARQNPKRRRRTNPQASAGEQKARKTYQMFAGRKPKRVSSRKVRAASVGPGKNYAKLGDLVKLVIKGGEISFDEGPRPIVATDAAGKRIYFIGGDQSLDQFPAVKASHAARVDLGEVYQLEYFARKKFDDFIPVVYFHELGEDNGKRPNLIYDRKRKVMRFAGGDYKIRAEGIVN